MDTEICRRFLGEKKHKEKNFVRGQDFLRKSKTGLNVIR